MKRKIVLSLAIILLAAAALVVPNLRAMGYTMTRATVRLVCPMIFIDGRALPFALAYVDDVGLFPVAARRAMWVSVDPGKREVRAAILGMFEARSVHYPGEGCVLQ